MSDRKIAFHIPLLAHSSQQDITPLHRVVLCLPYPQAGVVARSFQPSLLHLNLWAKEKVNKYQGLSWQCELGMATLRKQWLFAGHAST